MSKKRSASRRDEQADRLVYFVDRCLASRTVVEIMRGAGFQVIAHSDRFRDDAPDEEWLTAAGEHEWVVITRDQLRERPIERITLTRAGVRAIVVKRPKLKAAQIAELIVAHKTGIERICSKEPAPFIAILGGSGLRVHLRAIALNRLRRNAEGGTK